MLETLGVSQLSTSLILPGSTGIPPLEMPEFTLTQLSIQLMFPQFLQH
jgi:hypothetical protein